MIAGLWCGHLDRSPTHCRLSLRVLDDAALWQVPSQERDTERLMEDMPMRLVVYVVLGRGCAAGVCLLLPVQPRPLS